MRSFAPAPAAARTARRFSSASAACSSKGRSPSFSPPGVTGRRPLTYAATSRERATARVRERRRRNRVEPVAVARRLGVVARRRTRASGRDARDALPAPPDDPGPQGERHRRPARRRDEQLALLGDLSGRFFLPTTACLDAAGSAIIAGSRSARAARAARGSTCRCCCVEEREAAPARWRIARIAPTAARSSSRRSRSRWATSTRVSAASFFFSARRARLVFRR